MDRAEWDVTHLHPVTGMVGWDNAAMHRSGAGAEREPASDPSEAYALALLREREGYVRRGLVDRVAAVDAELTRIGHPIASAPQASTKQPAARKRRTASRTASTDAGTRAQTRGATPDDAA